jgi:glycosyltransferase involved in cell wall biosynthesis
MRIVVLGTRGIPDIQGGVEAHCEALYPRLAQLGHEVILITRSPYVINFTTEYQCVKLRNLYAPKIKSLEAIVHSLLGVIVASSLKPDILHIHAIGPSLVIPIARLLNLKVVMTHHGADYERKKWGKLARIILKLGERFAANYAHKIIAISKTIQSSLELKYNRNSFLIYNGINPVEKTLKTDYLDSLFIKPKRYIIAVGRFVEEKGFHDLISAFAKLKNKTSYQLILVGDADHKTEYSENLIQLAKYNKVVLTGFIKGKKLQEIYSHAELFILPSYHEGLPISLLEAISYHLKVLVSNIPAHTEIGLSGSCYFEVGNIEHLAQKIYESVASSELPDYSMFLDKYNWDKIAKQTDEIYQEMF